MSELPDSPIEGMESVDAVSGGEVERPDEPKGEMEAQAVLVESWPVRPWGRRASWRIFAQKGGRH
jgi:hypothetical protein